MAGFPQILAAPSNGSEWLFTESFGSLMDVDKQEHADRLREAIADNPGSRQQIADAVGKSYRTIGNWTSKDSPTMPSASERAIIRRIVGDYDEVGDPVEKALQKTRLVPWRQRAVVTEYERQLHLQDQEEAG